MGETPHGRASFLFSSQRRCGVDEAIDFRLYMQLTPAGQLAHRSANGIRRLMDLSVSATRPDSGGCCAGRGATRAAYAHKREKAAR